MVRIHGSGSTFTRSTITELSGPADYSTCTTGPRPCNNLGLALTTDDRVIVADTWNDQLWEGDGSGGATRYGSGLDDPTGVAAGRDGTVYATDTGNDRVVGFAPGSRIQSDVVTGLQAPTGIAVVPVSPEEVGDAFVGTADGSVLRIRDGVDPIAIASGLDPVIDLVVRDDGDVVVATGDRLVEMSGDGATVSELATFAEPVQALALASDDDLLVAVDDGSGGTEVRRVAPGGADTFQDASPLYPITALAGDDLSELYAGLDVGAASLVLRLETADTVGDPFAEVSGLAWDPSGSFVVADASAGTVSRLSTAGTATALASGIGGPGRVALDLDGDVLVTASGTDALLLVPAAGGSPMTVATVTDPAAVGVYVPRPTLAPITGLPDTGNVGTAYDGYDFDAAGNGGGTVRFRSLGTLPPGLTLDPATGELAGTPTTAGDYTFRVVAHNGARSAVSDEQEIEIGKRLQSISFTSTAPSHAYPDDTYTPTVTGGGSGNAVVLSIDPTSSTVCSYDAGTGVVSLLTGGTCRILADQAGSASYEAAPTAHQDVYVDKLVQTVDFTTIAPTNARIGDTYAPAAAGGPSANPVAFAITGSPLPPTFSYYACSYDAGTGLVTFEHAGTCRVTATKGGDDRYWSQSRSQNITVGVADLVFTSTKPSPGRIGDSYTPMVNAPAANYWISDGDGTVCEWDSVNERVDFLAVGQCEVTADVYDSDYTPDTISQTITVARRAQTITFTTMPPASGPIGGTYTPAATGGASGNPVLFSIAPASAGTCSLAGGVVHLDHAGTCVVRADQAGDADYEPADQASQTIIIAKNPSSVTITSEPLSAVVGQTYAVTAASSPAGGAVGVVAQTPAVCHVTAATVTFDHAGVCEIRATWPGDADHEASSADQTVEVSPAATSTTLEVRASAMVAAVDVVAPGGGVPSGEVEFTENDTVLGTADLETDRDGNLVATLVWARASGGHHQIVARYLGSDDHAASEGTVAWTDPTISATVSSKRKKTHGWYRTPVTLTFSCAAGSAPLVGECPAPLVLAKDRSGWQSITRSVTAEDGGWAEVTVSGLRIDLTAPTVKVKGARPGASYAGKRTLRCVARDATSGVDRCVVKQKRVAPHRFRWTATAWDRAGNKTVVRGGYRVR